MRRLQKFPELFDVQESSIQSHNRSGHPGKTHAMTRYVPLTLSLQYQLHLALYPTGLVQHSNPYTRLHHQLNLDQQHKGSFKTLLGMVDSTQETGSSPGSSILCAQKSPATSQPSPASTQGMSTQSNSTQVPQSQTQNVGTRSTFCSKHTSLSAIAYCTPATSHCCYSPQFQAHMLHQCSRVSHNLCNPRVNPQGQPIRQPMQPSPFR